MAGVHRCGPTVLGLDRRRTGREPQHHEDLSLRRQPPRRPQRGHRALHLGPPPLPAAASWAAATSKSVASTALPTAKPAWTQCSMAATSTATSGSMNDALRLLRRRRRQLLCRRLQRYMDVEIDTPRQFRHQQHLFPQRHPRLVRRQRRHPLHPIAAITGHRSWNCPSSPPKNVAYPQPGGKPLHGTTCAA